MRYLITFAAIAFVTPALAQFPPPGIYSCVTNDGTPWGELTLMVAGDYHFRDIASGVESTGQLASSGTSVAPVSGLLDERRLSGVFETDETGKTVFRFDGPEGLVVTCS